MSRNKRTLLNAAATGLVAPALVSLTKSLALVAAFPFVAVTNVGGALDGGLLLLTAVGLFALKEHYHELALSEDDVSLLRRVIEGLAQRLARHAQTVSVDDESDSTSTDESGDSDLSDATDDTSADATDDGGANTQS